MKLTGRKVLLMNEFQFNQNPKERSCGWRCLHYIFPKKIAYKDFLQEFRYLTPTKSGIWFKNITSILNYLNIDYKFTIPSEKGIYLIWSGNWNTTGGHYFIYNNGYMFDSLESKPYKLPLKNLIKKTDTKNSRHHMICLQVKI